IDPGGDRVVRDLKVAGGGRPEGLLGENAVFVTEGFARRQGLKTGDNLNIVAGGVTRSVPIAGLLELSGVARAAGGDLVVPALFTAQKLLGRPGLVDRVDIVLAPGESRPAIEKEIRAKLPEGLSLSPPQRSAATADRMVRAFRFNLNA